MYKIYADDTLIYDSTFEDYKIAKGTISLETNKSGSFVFSIYPDHFYYDNFVKLKTVITVYKSGDIIFRGRILNDISDYWNNKVITCEGELGFLQDSIIRPFNFTGTPEELFTKFITDHNAQVDEFKRFKIGTVSVTDPNDYIVRENADYVSALDNLNTRLLDGALGGYFYITHDDGDTTPTIHYLADFTNVATQTIEFGANLKNYTKTVKADTLKTAIIPLGASVNDKRLTITGVNGGKDYVYDETGVSLYGWIIGTAIWDDVTNASNLKSKAEAYLQTIMTQNVTIELNAIDLHLIDKSIDSFRLGDYIRVISEPHNFDSTLLCNRMTIDLLKPENDTLILGYTYATFTETNSKYSAVTASITQIKTSVNNLNNNVSNISNDVIVINEEIEKIKEGGTESPKIEQLHDDIEALADAITQNAQNININKTAIAVNAANIKTNADDITQLEKDKESLASAITLNTANIKTNTDDISALILRVEALEENDGGSTSELPSGFTKLSYIQSSGAQYIDTGFKPNQNTRVLIDCQVMSISGATINGLHIASVVGSTYFYTLFVSSEEKIGSRYGTQAAQLFVVGEPQWQERLVYDKNKNITSVGGYSNEATYETFQLAYTLYLFARNNKGTTDLFSSTKLYSCRIFDNGGIIRNFIPCINANGEYGLYDKVNGQFYANAGTGSFTGG